MNNKLLDKMIIGIDFPNNGDKPTYVVMVKDGDKYELMDAGQVEEFSFGNYIDGERNIHIVGEKEDLERLKEYKYNTEIQTLLDDVLNDKM